MTLLDRGRDSTAGAEPGAPSLNVDEISSTPVRQTTVLILGADVRRRGGVVTIIEEAGWLPLIADDRAEAVRIVRGALPDLFVLLLENGSDDDPGVLGVLDDVRNTVDGELVPIVCMLEHRSLALTIDAFGRRADDVVWGRPDSSELIARLRARIERRPIPATELVEDPVTGALTPRAFGAQLAKEHERVARGGDAGALAFLALDELPGITARLGSRARDELLAEVVRLIEVDGRQLDFVGSRRGILALLLPGTPSKGAQARCDRLARKIYDHEFAIDGEPVAVTPIIGFTESTANANPDELESRAWDAMAYQAAHLDLHPTRWVPAMSQSTTAATGFRRTFDRYRTPVQVVVQQLTVFALPLLTYWLLDSIGADITGFVYVGLVLALGVTATLIWGESHTALEPTVPPEAPDEPPPRASAIIAAYLPNEAGTVVETVEAFLRQDYPDLEVILAYNTPTRLEVEDELRAIADRDPRFVPLRVDGSVSKAQNVNAALAHVTGEFLGLFDADHHPAPGSFHRAWCWIADGAGVVQGHCVIRNGDTNFVTRLVATEFEAIYAVSHPGRARLHGFGIFGGSNGYWRTSLLHRTRMRGSMLTEDIDSSMRVVQSGEVIISDPELISTELAPDTAGALWNQRLRWAQGWSQVSLRHLIRMTRNAPTLRHRLGIAYLLGWREIYPWISLQMFPLLTYWWIQGEPPIEWFVPIFVFTTVLTFSAGPAQTWYSWRLAHPSIKQHKRWFVTFLLSSLVFYTEMKNVVARTADLKELMRERKWKVTPRTGSVALDAEAAQEQPPAHPSPIDDRPTTPRHAPTDNDQPTNNQPATPDHRPTTRHHRSNDHQPTTLDHQPTDDQPTDEPANHRPTDDEPTPRRDESPHAETSPTILGTPTANGTNGTRPDRPGTDQPTNNQPATPDHRPTTRHHRSNDHQPTTLDHQPTDDQPTDEPANHRPTDDEPTPRRDESPHAETSPTILGTPTANGTNGTRPDRPGTDQPTNNQPATPDHRPTTRHHRSNDHQPTTLDHQPTDDQPTDDQTTDEPANHRPIDDEPTPRRDESPHAETSPTILGTPAPGSPPDTRPDRRGNETPAPGEQTQTTMTAPTPTANGPNGTRPDRPDTEPPTTTEPTPTVAHPTPSATDTTRPDRPDTEPPAANELTGGELAEREAPAVADHEVPERRSTTQPPVYRSTDDDDRAPGAPPRHRRKRRAAPRRERRRRHRQRPTPRAAESRPTIYDFERELTIYDVERESVIYDFEAEVPDDPVQRMTPAAVRPTSVAEPVAPAPIDPLGPPAPAGRRPTIAGVDGGLITPTRIVGTEPDDAGAGRSDPLSPTRPARSDLAVPGMTGHQGGADLGLHESADVQARRTRRQLVDDPRSPGS